MEPSSQYPELTDTRPIDVPSAGRQALIVNTDRPFARLLQTYLMLNGWSALACTGREAVRDRHKLRPDAIVMDLDGSDVDGFDLLTWLRAEFPRVHIIVCSQYPEPCGPEAQAWGVLGIARWIRRPCALHVVEAVLSDVCCESAALPRP